MVNSSVLKSSFCVFLLAVSPVCGAYTPLELPTPEAFLKDHLMVTATLSVVAAAAYAATPTEGEYDCSMEKFSQNPYEWAKNVFGWRKKDGKWKVNKHNDLIFDPGYEAAGLVGATADTGKMLVTFASLAILLKAIEPIMKQLELLQVIKVKKTAGA